MSDSEQQRMRSASPSRNADTNKKELSSHREDQRKRSRSPRRDRKDGRPQRKDAGFKWKEKRRDDDEPRGYRDEGLRRGYRDQYRPRSRSKSPRPRDGDRRGPAGESRRQERDRPDKSEKKERRDKSKPVANAPQQEMILVTVNDRLGTKKQIPCLPSDTVKDFKTVVAMMIGRRPHEIMLKRQSERPFKDFLTLQDYGVSNNVQLDLEVDTGD